MQSFDDRKNTDYPLVVFGSKEAEFLDKRTTSNPTDDTGTEYYTSLVAAIKLAAAVGVAVVAVVAAVVAVAAAAGIASAVADDAAAVSPTAINSSERCRNDSEPQIDTGSALGIEQAAQI